MKAEKNQRVAFHILRALGGRPKNLKVDIKAVFPLGQWISSLHLHTLALVS